MRRGDIVVASAPGDYGKPRPYLVIQSDVLTGIDSLILCPLTTDVRELAFRVIVEPAATNGLRRRSEIMVDKALALPTSRIRGVIGNVELWRMAEIDAALRLVLGL